MNALNLKQKLLSLGIFQDNEYLNKYIDLVVTNENTIKERNKTQRHHIIPRQYFKINNLPIDNSDDNLVNLTFSDHAKSHYYLALCIEDIALKNGMILAFNYLINKKTNGIELDKLSNEENFFNNLQNLYQLSKEYMNKIRTIKLSGRVLMHKDNRQYTFDCSLLESKLAEGYTRGPLLSTRQKIAETVGHKIWVTDGKIDLCINDTDSIPNGFARGKSKNYFQLGKTETNELNRRINLSKAHKGKQLTKATKEKLSYINKYGDKRTSLRKWMNNGIINTRVLDREVSNYLKQGWVLGKIGKNKPCSSTRKQKISTANKGRIYIYKGDVVKAVKKDELQNYIEQGWIIKRKIKDE